MKVMIALLILHVLLVILNVDPPAPITVNNATWYYGTYAETIVNNTNIYTGVNINDTVTINISNNLPVPINISYTLSIDGYVKQGSMTVQPGTNVLNITTPALSKGNYDATLSIYTTGYSVNYYFTVNSVVPGVEINTTTTSLYSGIAQPITLSITNTTPIPITSASILISGTNVVIGTSSITVTPPVNESITAVPGPYSLHNATITFKINYVDAGGYTWSSNETLSFTIIPTPVYISLNMTSSTVSYGNYLPVTITAVTPIGPLQNQKLSIYVDNNYVTSVTTNAYGQAQYLLPVNYNVGYHELEVVFTNTTYFQKAIANYTFIVIPGTVYISAYLSNSSITYGNAVTIYVEITPPISGGSLTISYTLNGQSSTIGSYAPVNGSVQVVWIPPQAGTYLITIYYENPPNYLPSYTNITLTVSRAPCTIIITTNGTSEVLHEVVVIGKMKPAIVNAQIDVTISVNSTVIKGSTYINASGIGEYVFTPQLPGEYVITMSWPGNINYKSCSASYILNIEKAPLELYVNGSRNLIATGSFVTFRIMLVTNIPIYYITGNLTIMIINGNRTVSEYTVPIKSSYIEDAIPFYQPGSYEVFISYPGNDYVNPITYGPYYITVIPGVLGIPWYILIAYLLPIGLGIVVGIIINHRLYQSSQ